MNRALRLTGSKAAPTLEIASTPIASLPRQGDTLVRIAYSSLNYKDGLAVTGKGKIVRADFPFIPGIDLVGEVIETSSSELFPGDWVIGTGWSIGEEYWGGYSQHQWVRSEWLVSLPEGLSPVQAMTVGTAGLTAMIAVDALEHQGLVPDRGPVLVTGASGGVGSFAVAILAAIGCEVAASTGKKSSHDYLRGLGASDILDRSILSAGAQHPMESAKWAGAIDSVGSTTLEAVIAQLKRHASVAVCGLAGGATLNTSVFPFILRGANLLGVDSNTCPNSHRTRLWERLTEIVGRGSIPDVGQIVKLGELPGFAESIVNGGIQGRIVVDVNG